MKECMIENKTTGEKDFIFGYSWNNAVRRSGINANEWTLVRVDYDEIGVDYK